MLSWLLACVVVSDQSGGETRWADPGAGISSEAAGKLTAEAQHAAAQQRHAVPAASRRPGHTQWVGVSVCVEVLILCLLKCLYFFLSNSGRVMIQGVGTCRWCVSDSHKEELEAPPVLNCWWRSHNTNNLERKQRNKACRVASLTSALSLWLQTMWGLLPEAKSTSCIKLQNNWGLNWSHIKCAIQLFTQWYMNQNQLKSVEIWLW